MPRYNRVVFKLSGETLAPVRDEDRLDKKKSPCFHEGRVNEAADMIARVYATGVQIGIVMGGGNIWRGRFSDDMDPIAADQMGMLASILNALCVEEALTRRGIKARAFTVQEMNRFAQLYTARDAIEAMEKGYVVLLGGGTGNPFFTTDSGAALRAAELKADAILKGTTVDGVYDRDPNKDRENAVFFKDLTYRQAIEMRLNVMDITAYEICIKGKVGAIRVFNMNDLENIVRVARGEDIGSTIHL